MWTYDYLRLRIITRIIISIDRILNYSINVYFMHSFIVKVITNHFYQSWGKYYMVQQKGVSDKCKTIPNMYQFIYEWFWYFLKDLLKGLEVNVTVLKASKLI